MTITIVSYPLLTTMMHVVIFIHYPGEEICVSVFVVIKRGHVNSKQSCNHPIRW